MSKLTPEIINDILERVSSGKSVASSLARHGISFGTWYRWTETTEGMERYPRARIDCAHSNADAIQEVAELVASGALTPEQGRVINDSRKWTAARLHFPEYGDRKQVDNTVKFEDMSDDELNERIRRLTDGQ